MSESSSAPTEWRRLACPRCNSIIAVCSDLQTAPVRCCVCDQTFYPTVSWRSDTDE